MYSTLQEFKKLTLLLLFFSVSCVADTNTGAGMEFIEVRPGIFVRFGRQEVMSVENKGDIANTGFVVGETSIAVIDPGGSPELGLQMRKAIKQISNLPVSHLILTHMHPDHVFGAAAFADVPNVVAHKKFARASTQRGVFYREAFSELFNSDKQPTTLLPNIYDFKTLMIELGGRSLEVQQHETGHTDNDISVWDPKTRTLWASDLLFVDRIPSLDGSLTGWISVLQELSSKDIETVVPGHGGHGPWEALLAPQLSYLTTLLSQTRKIIAQNGRLADALESVAIDERSKWILFDLRHRGNITKAFTELEWE